MGMEIRNITTFNLILIKQITVRATRECVEQHEIIKKHQNKNKTHTVIIGQF